MAKTRVAILRGGPGHEYSVSLATGQSVLEHLPEHYERHDILIDKSGTWHYRGLPLNPSDLPRYADVVWNALHGEYGEDGQVQQVLDRTGLPYTGSGHFAAATGMNKAVAKEVFRRAGLRVPRGQLILRSDLRATQGPTLAAQAVFRHLAPPWIVKPADRGSSVGLYFARTFPELAVAIAECFRFSDRILVEEYIRGREATVGVIADFRGKAHYALPPIEIRRPGNQAVWTYVDKYNGATAEICPGNFTPEEKQELETSARAAHQALGLSHYSRSDFIIPASPAGGSNRGIYLLETNSLPGLTAESLLPKALNAVGCSYADFLDHVIKLALNR